MVSVTVSPAGKPISIARGLPSQFDVPGKQVQDATIGDIKAVIAKKFRKVSPTLNIALRPITLDLSVLSRASKNHSQRQQKRSQ